MSASVIIFLLAVAVNALCQFTWVKALADEAFGEHRTGNSWKEYAFCISIGIAVMQVSEWFFSFFIK